MSGKKYYNQIYSYFSLPPTPLRSALRGRRRKVTPALELASGKERVARSRAHLFTGSIDFYRCSWLLRNSTRIAQGPGQNVINMLFEWILFFHWNPIAWWQEKTAGLVPVLINIRIRRLYQKSGNVILGLDPGISTCWLLTHNRFLFTQEWRNRTFDSASSKVPDCRAGY